MLALAPSVMSLYDSKANDMTVLVFDMECRIMRKSLMIGLVLCTAVQAADKNAQKSTKVGGIVQRRADQARVHMTTPGPIERVKQRFPALEIPAIDGMFHLVYEPDPSKPFHWFVNDHCLFRAPDGKIHFFGIENPYPSTAVGWERVKPQVEFPDRPFIKTINKMIGQHLYQTYPGNFKTHYRIGHAVADEIWGPWKRLPAVLQDKERKTNYGAPYVVQHDGRYYMLLDAPTGLAVSNDLMNWEEIEAKTPWQSLGHGHRDPMVIRDKDGTYLQYYTGGDPKKRQVISIARSRDLSEWERLEPCYVGPLKRGPSWGIYESPYMLEHNGLYYLFVCFAHRRYDETYVVVSDNPLHFDHANTITTVFTHAPEFIEIDGQTYVSGCGIEDPQMLNRSGLWIAKLKWLKP